jgi:carbamoyltransferase
VLGISASHNGAVCLLKGDEIVVAIQEERLSRRKRHRISGAQHTMSLDYCFDYAGITPRDLSMIVITVQGPATAASQDLTQNPFLKVKEYGTPTRFVSHHFAHAVSAYATSGFRESDILVIDGIGSPAEDMSDDERGAVVNPMEGGWEIISLYSARGARLKSLEKHLAEGKNWLTPGQQSMPRFRSLGGIFSAAAVQIFGADLEAGKVMGLAPYGHPVFPVEEFFEMDGNRFAFSEKISSRFNHAERWPQHQEEYQDLSASAQNALEVALLYLVEHLHELSPSDNLCYAGGVALNSVANERIIRESKFKNVYIMPAAEDSGPAIGAAYHGLWELTKKNTRRRLLHDAVGREYSPAEIGAAVAETPGTVPAEAEDVLDEAVERLIQGQIVGWFQGRSELGPRALGQRSILCDPRRADGKEVLNSRVKHREAFRPFAPVILIEEAHNWFELEGVNPDSGFMLRVCPFKEEKKALVPAVVHVDGTGRIQTVTREANGRFYDLIRKFYERTGVPIVLNTSFNVMGMPIVETPEDALQCMLSTGIDYCVLGDLIVGKREDILLGQDVKAAPLPAPPAEETEATPAAGMLTRRPLKDYTGTYGGNPTGDLLIKRDGRQLTATHNGRSTTLRRVAEEAFEVTGELFKGFKLSFFPDRNGFVGRVVIDMGERGQAVFTREPQRRRVTDAFMKRCAGEYALDGKRLRVIRDGETGAFAVEAPGQPRYLLVPGKGEKFALKNTPGYALEFRQGQQNGGPGLIVTQPNGVFFMTKVK